MPRVKASTADAAVDGQRYVKSDYILFYGDTSILKVSMEQ